MKLSMLHYFSVDDTPFVVVEEVTISCKALCWLPVDLARNKIGEVGLCLYCLTFLKDSTWTEQLAMCTRTQASRLQARQSDGMGSDCHSEQA